MVESLGSILKRWTKCWKECECCGHYIYFIVVDLSNNALCDDCRDEIDKEEWYMQHMD